MVESIRGVIMKNIENTTIEEVKDNDGTLLVYEVTPNEGFLLHNNVNDYTEPDAETGAEILHLGFSSASSTVPLDYDFDNTKKIDGYTAYGSKEVFAIPRDKVDDKQVF